ncbi:MAG: hypothetical protein JNL32_12470 [Candidatus Kapabacteria bacterium]|nr:hypothetical protein [Candidatus Kapabacteria bacterium]
MENEEYQEYRSSNNYDVEEEGRWALYLQLVSMPIKLVGGILAVLSVILLFVKGIRWYWELFYPLVSLILSVPILLLFPLGLVLCLFKKTRGLGGILLVLSSMLYLFVNWSQALAFAYIHAGRIWMLIGFFMAGVGVFFMAAIGAVIQGEYTDAINVVVSVAIFLVVHYFGFWMVFIADESEKAKHLEEKYPGI